MTSDAKSEIIQILEQSRHEFNAAAGGVAESHASVKPAADRWSVLECVEHVAGVEERFLARLENAPRMEALRIDKGKEAELAVMVVNRTVRAQAPEPTRPAGRFSSLAQAMEQFNASRARTIRFAEERGEDLYWLALEHPRFGAMNGVEFAVIIAGHARRHAEQIREVRAGLGQIDT